MITRVMISKDNLLEQINYEIRRHNQDDRTCDDCWVENIRQIYEDRAIGEANWTVDFVPGICKLCDYDLIINTLRTRFDVDWPTRLAKVAKDR